MSDLNDGQSGQLEELLRSYEDIFSSGTHDFGRTNKITHKINTGDTIPIRQPPRRLPGNRREEVGSMIQTMIGQDVIQPSCSPWAAPIVLVKKKDGSTRFCVDYRRLNDVTKKDAYPSPRIDDTLDALAGAKMFSTLDLASGYWQVKLDPDDREKTAFVTLQGLYEFNVMPFGLCNAPSTIQWLMEFVLTGLQWSICLIYLDDVIIFSKNFDDHLRRMEEVFGRLREAGLKLKPQKCRFFQKEVTYLGHVVSENGVSTDPSKVSKILDWPIPRNLSELRSFLGLASYYRRFIKDFAKIAVPLHRLTEKNKPFVGSESCLEAFNELKRELTNHPILENPDFNKEFILDTDASDYGIGGVLSQIEGNEERVIGYASRSLTKPERRYSTTRKELLAIVAFIQHFRHYLYGKSFIIRTDHNALKWLKSFKEPQGQMARWIELLAEFNFVVQHRPGTKHGNADGLSRRAEKENEIETEEKQEVGVIDRTGVAVETVRERKRRRAHEATRSEVKSDGAKELFNWLGAEGFTESIKLEQRNDEIISPIIKSLEEGVRLNPEEIQGSSQEARNLWSNWSRLVLQDDILYRRWKSEDGRKDKLQAVVPKSLKQTVLHSLHNSPSRGHLGITKTLHKVRDRFYWHGLRNDVEVLCKSCKMRGSRNNPQCKPRAPLVPSKVGFPGERLAMDIVSPFPKSDQGKKYVLIISDCFTRWTEAYPIPNQEAVTIAETLVKEYICRYGVPQYLHTDQGRNFESKLIKNVCELLGIKKTRTSPYHPQSDGMVERFNRTLEAILSKYVSDNQRDWDVHLLLVMMAYRSSVHEATTFTPYFMMFGREICLPIDIMLGTHVNQEPKTHGSYTATLRAETENVYQMVRTRMQRVQ